MYLSREWETIMFLEQNIKEHLKNLRLFIKIMQNVSIRGRPDKVSRGISLYISLQLPVNIDLNVFNMQIYILFQNKHLKLLVKYLFTQLNLNHKGVSGFLGEWDIFLENLERKGLESRLLSEWLRIVGYWETK